MPENIEKKDLNILLTFMNEGLMIFEQSGVISYANAKACELMGVKDAEGMTLEEISENFIYEDGSPIVVEDSAVMYSLKTGLTPPEKTYKCLTTGRWMSGSSVPVIEVSGKVSKVFVLFHDVTDLKISELSKEELIMEREKFYQMITHDLKNPLTTITLAASLIRKMSPELPLTLRHIETILKSTVFMSSLIDELIKLASVQSKKMKLRYEDIDFMEIISLLEKHFELQLEIKKLKLDIRRVKFTCQGDRERIFQVMMNLVGNAIKFSNEGGTITIDIKDNETHCLISVKDTGPGIPKEKIKKIFEPYYQIKKSDAFKGHGLGLTIVKHIVEAHQGKVWAESKEGIGSSFHVMLPKINDTGNFGNR